MNKKQAFLTILVSALLATFVFAQDEHLIDKSLGECLDNSKSITAETTRCLEETYTKWEAELDKYYNLLMGVLDKESKERLRKSQAAWVKFRDLEFEFIPYYFQDIGSYQGPTMRGNKVDIIRDRALRLQAYYETIQDGLPENK